MSVQRDRQQGPPDLPIAPDSLRQAVSDSFVKGVGSTAGGESPQGRPHQIDAVTALVTAVRQDCHHHTATNYLLQHSAGSGKSLTIAALVAALLRTEDEAGRRFHSVLVVNDRLQLDQQLGDTVSSFIAGNGFPANTVARANSSSQLRSFLLAPASDSSRPAVILTTIQKLSSLWRNTDSKAWRRARKQSGTSKPRTNDQDPDDLDHAAPDADQIMVTNNKTLEPGSTDQIELQTAGADCKTLADVQSDARSNVLGALAQGRVAIIADEAHRHHGNSTSEQISAILAAAFGSGGSTAAAGSSKKRKQGQIAEQHRDAAAQQQQQPRFVTYFGFTATPGPRALQLFGVAQQVQVDILGTVISDPAAPAAAAAGGAREATDAAMQPSVLSTTQQQQQQKKQQMQQGVGKQQEANLSGHDQPEDAQQQQQQYTAPATLYAPFHCYTLQQATSDGFVLDVLQRFVSVTPRIQIAGLQLTEQQQQQLLKLDQANRLGLNGGSSSAARSLRSDLIGSHAAAAAAARSAAGIDHPTAGSHNPSGPSLAEELLVQAASNSRQLVAVKAEAVVDHFMSAWTEAAACGFVGFRAMLVVRSRQHVVWYVQELRRLLQQHSQQAAELLKQAGEPVDTRSSAAVAAGDTAPLCYGAYSGSVAITTAEAQRLWSSSSSGGEDNVSLTAAAAVGKRKRPSAAAAGGAGAVKLRNGSSGSRWDAALADFDAQHQQQQDEQQQAVVDLAPQDLAAAAAAAAGVQQEDSSWFLRSSWPSSAGQQQQIGGSSSSESEAEAAQAVNNATVETGSDSGSEHLAGSSSSSSSDSESDSNEDEQDRDAVAVARAAAAEVSGSRRRKRVRRDSSTLSCSTANTAAAAAAEEAEDQGSDPSPDLRSSDPEDDQPLSVRLQQQQQQPPVTAAAAAMEFDATAGDVVFVSERDLNPAGFGPGDARLLVVCSKFETGYDDPRLGAMFVDRSLSGARAVQVLGRINRPAPGKGLPRSAASIATADSARSAAQSTDTDLRIQQHIAADLGVSNGELTNTSDDNGIKKEPDDLANAGTAAAAAVSGVGIAAPAAGVAATAAAEGGVPGFKVLVVDFMNSVGAIKEAFSEFYGTTTYCTGSQAKRRRQQQAMDDATTRILEILQPAAARQATRQQLLLQQQQQQQQQQGNAIAAGNTSNSSSSSNGSLASMNVSQMVNLVGGLPPETQKRVEEDLSQYCSCCTRLRLEKLEFPYIYAQAWLTQLTARRQRRDKAASSGRFAWMEQLHTAAEAAAAADHGDQGVTHPDQCAAAGDLDEQQQQEVVKEGGDHDADDSTNKQPRTASKLRQKLNVSVRVCELETTFAGAVKLSASDHPLRSVKLTSHLSATAAAAARSGSSAAAAAAAALNPDKQVRSGRPLHEVIAAANAQLAGRFKKQVVEGLRELCEKLKGAEGRLLAIERLRQAQRAAAAVPAAAVRVEVLRDPQQQQQGLAAGLKGQAAAAAAAAAGAAEVDQLQQQPRHEAAAAAANEGEDVYKILTLLRRLQLWPVTAELLKATAAGKQVSALRNHNNPLVANLATEVVQQWKAQLNAQAAAAAAAARKAKEQQAGDQGAGSSAAAAGKASGQPAAAIDQTLRGKVANMMRDASIDHRQKVLEQQQQQQQQIGEASAAARNSRNSSKVALPARELSRLQHLADVLELELYQYATNANQSNGGNSGPAAAAAGSGSSSRGVNAVQEYKTRARMLCTGLRYVDGVAPDLISGAKIASEVVGLDALSLAPAAVQDARRRRQEEQRRAEEHWESLVQGSVGAGGTFVTTEVACPQCGKKRAQVHNILSGGTYAQERVPIQKYVCQECLHTWRND